MNVRNLRPGVLSVLPSDHRVSDSDFERHGVWSARERAAWAR